MSISTANSNLIPRRYGEPTDKRYEVAMDALTDAIAWTRTGWYERWAAMYVEQLTEADGSRLGLSLERARGMLSFYLQAAAEGLPSAAPVYVDEEIVALLDVARTSLPAARLDESDVFIPSGFVWFEQAFPLFYEENDLSGFGWTVTASLEGAPVVAMTSFVEGNGMVLPQQVIPLTFGEVPEEVDGSPFVRLAVSFWLLSSQRLFASAQERVSRAARRRAKSEIKTVLVATIRRKVYPEAGGTRSVEWSHRWLVGGHWRNQWFPGEQRHKPVWIAPYVKGPEGKPLVAKGRAFEFKR